jgi:hypothetical protein
MSMRLTTIGALFIVFSNTASFAEDAADVAKEPPRASFILLPLHVHILSCDDQADLDCKLTDDDIKRVIGKVNRVWHKAGIHFRIESLLHEKAVEVKEFERVRAEKDAHHEPLSLGAYRGVAPPETLSLPGLHVYYIHHFTVNGVFLGQGICFVQETAKLRPVEGGIDEPLPRVTSHELGHAMGLPHRQNTTNLMASGTTGILLNEAEVKIARKKAQQIIGAMTVAECEKAIEESQAKGAEDRPKSLREALEALPKE